MKSLSPVIRYNESISGYFAKQSRGVVVTLVLHRRDVHFDERHDALVAQHFVVVDHRMVAADDLLVLHAAYGVCDILSVFVENVGEVLRVEPGVVLEQFEDRLILAADIRFRHDGVPILVVGMAAVPASIDDNN